MNRRSLVQDYPREDVLGDAARHLRLVEASAGDGRASLVGRWIDQFVDRLIYRSSLVATTPVLDVRAHSWTCDLRVHWQTIRDEAVAVGALTPLTCPATAALISKMPNVYAARFERLLPGAHAVVHRRGGRGLLTCHLGLEVPRDGDLRMRMGERVVRWAEGETLLFDAMQAQAWWNDSADAGLVLVVELRRPLRQPGRWIAGRLLR